MNTQEAIEKLDKMQSQIIHGKRIFGDIADVIRASERVRLSALFQIGLAIENIETGKAAIPSLAAAHRILANNHADGVFAGATVNSISSS